MNLPNNKILFNFAIDLFKAHICEKYGPCEVCAVWLIFAEKHNWTDRYPTEPNWSFDEPE